MNCNYGKYFQLTAVLLLAAAGQLAAQQRPDPLVAPLSAAPLWEQRIGDTVKGIPHLQAGSVVLAGERGTIKSFYMSGTPLWNFDANGRAVQYLARSYEAASYVCGADGVFRAINRVGRELWRLRLDKPVSFNPVVGWDGRIFIPVESKVTCRTASGNALWTIDLGSQIIFAPILDKTGSFTAVLQNQDFVKVDQFSNIERIRLDRVPIMIVSLKEENQQSYVLFHQSGEMEKIIFDEKARAGSRLSRARLGSLPAVPVAAESYVSLFTVILKDGRTLCLNEKGSVLWTRNNHEATAEKGSGNLAMNQAYAVFDERGVYSISTRGITGFTAEGRRRFVHRLQIESSGVPALSDEGLLYVCGKDDVLRVFKIDAKPRTIPVVKYYGPAPEGSYGMGNPPPSPWTGDRSRYQNESQDIVYAQIEAAIKSGQLGKDEPVYVAYLMEMVGFFLGYPQTSEVRPDVDPDRRIKYIRLLSLVGSRETIPFLWNIFDRDREPAVRRACADAIGTIGVDPTGRSFESYNYLLAANNPNTDPQLVLAATSSIASLCRFSGPPLAPDGIRILRYFSNLPTLPNNVKTQIRNELDGLLKEDLDKMIK